MKIKTTTTTTEEKEVTLPFYFKRAIHFFKMIDDKCTIGVTFAPNINLYGIETRDSEGLFTIPYKEISAEEFNNIFKRTKQKLELLWNDQNQ